MSKLIGPLVGIMGPLGMATGQAAKWWQISGLSWNLATDAIWVAKGAASQAASYVNLLAAGTHDLTATVAPTWASATGWIFDGATQYLISDIVPTNGSMIMVQYTGVTVVGGRYICGAGTSGTARQQLGPRYTTDVVRYASHTIVSVAPGLAAGNLAIAAGQGYRNGVADGANSDDVGANTLPLLLGCTNNGGVPASFLACNIIGFIKRSTSPTAPQMLALATAMALL